MELSGFDDAFTSIADVVKKAATLPDHRERDVEPLEVEAVSPRGEVRVRVCDARIAWLGLDEIWHDAADTGEVSEMIIDTLNQALDDYNRQYLAQMSDQLPELNELGAAFQAANDKLDRAWAQTLTQAKVE